MLATEQSLGLGRGLTGKGLHKVDEDPNPLKS